MSVRTKHPGDVIVNSMAFDVALQQLRIAYEYEKAALYVPPHERAEEIAANGPDPIWDREIAKIDRALDMYQGAILKIVEQLMAEGLDQFARALETGDYESELRF